MSTPRRARVRGEYQSVFRGRGLEFEDARAYQYGDDVRAMDWKVTARTATRTLNVTSKSANKPSISRRCLA